MTDFVGKGYLWRDELGVVDGLDITVKTDYELLSVLALISFVTRDT